MRGYSVLKCEAECLLGVSGWAKLTLPPLGRVFRAGIRNVANWLTLKVPAQPRKTCLHRPELSWGWVSRRAMTIRSGKPASILSARGEFSRRPDGGACGRLIPRESEMMASFGRHAARPDCGPSMASPRHDGVRPAGPPAATFIPPAGFRLRPAGSGRPLP